MKTELEALQNFVTNIETPELSIHEYLFNDKRRTTKKYFLQLGKATISPTLDYENMNHFLLGFNRAKELFNS